MMWSYLSASRMRVIVTVVVATMAATSFPVLNAGGKRGANSKLDRELQKHSDRDGETLRVIITSPRGRRSAALEKRRAHGDVIGSEYAVVDAFSATIHAEDLEALENDSDVAHVSSDAVVTSDAADAAGAGEPSTLLETLGLDAVGTDGPTGKGIGIAVIDSGLERGTDLNGGEHDKQYVFAGGPKQVAPYDDYGHGTHVSGLIGGSGDGSQEDADRIGRDGKPHRVKVRVYRGVAPKARIISLKVLDANGAGLTSDVIEAIQFAVDNRERLKIDIINLSLGHPIYEPSDTDPLVQAVEGAVRAGIVVVASAGNYGRNPDTGLVGYAGITSPGNAPSAITVGALDTRGTASRLDDQVAPYSSRGPTWYDARSKPDLVAPGHQLVAAAAVRSSLYSQWPSRRRVGADRKTQYLALSGTSMSAAVTTGLSPSCSRHTMSSSRPPSPRTR